MTAPAESLRAAADRLRTLAGAASPGRWRTHTVDDGTDDGKTWVGFDDRAGFFRLFGQCAWATGGDAAYIAAVSPPVALAVADLLESASCGLRCDDDGMREPYCSACEDSTYDHDCPNRKPCNHTASYRRALAVARAINEQVDQ